MEDDARWAAVTCPKSGNNCESYKLLARDHQITQKLMEDQLGINEMSHQTLLEDLGKRNIRGLTIKF